MLQVPWKLKIIPFRERYVSVGDADFDLSIEHENSLFTIVGDMAFRAEICRRIDDDRLDPMVA
jgi:hypothetical protein